MRYEGILACLSYGKDEFKDGFVFFSPPHCARQHSRADGCSYPHFVDNLWITFGRSEGTRDAEGFIKLSCRVSTQVDRLCIRHKRLVYIGLQGVKPEKDI